MAAYTAAKESFNRARLKAFWNALISTVTGRSNELLAWDEVKDKLQIGGQIYRGIQQVEVSKIIGSVNRYRDFDRVFLPKQTHTEERWRSISSAYFELKHLPPVKLYKVGDAYFVVDGNHRVSVAREQKRVFIDAEVIEAESRVPVGPDLDAQDLKIKGEYAEFLHRTGLDRLRPEQEIEFTIAGGYQRLLEQIAVHRYFMGLEEQRFIPEAEAVTDWYDHLYLPLVKVIRKQEFLEEFPNRTEADLYLWVMEHLHYLREAGAVVTPEKAAEHFATYYTSKLLKRALHVVSGLWETIDDLEEEVDEQAAFMDQTHLDELRPDHGVNVNQPGDYQRLREHIAVHRHFMGLEFQRFVPEEEAVIDWYDTVYLPVVNLFRERGVIEEFPERTEAELYLWLMEHLQFLHEQGEYLSREEAVQDFIKRFTQRPLKEVLGMVEELLEVGGEPAGVTTYTDFLDATQLDRLRPDHHIAATITSGYRRLLEHIAAHRYFMGIEQQRFIPEEEAVVDWYDHVYSPIAEIIREHRLLQNFPRRTEADLYLWFMEHRHILWERRAQIARAEELEELAPDDGEKPLKRAVSAVQQLLKETTESASDDSDRQGD